MTTNVCLNHLTRYRARWRLFTEISPRDAGDADARPFEETLAASDEADRSLDDRVRDRIRDIVADATEFAQADPEPDVSELWTDVVH